MSDIFVQAIFAAGIYFMLKWTKDGPAGWLGYVALGVLCFCFVYAEWLGVMFAASLLYGWLNRDKPWAHLFQIAVAIGTGTALLLTIWQYSRVGGFRQFVNASEQQYLLRSGLGDQPEMNFHPWNPLGWMLIVTYLLLGYAVNFVFLALLGVAARNGPTLNTSHEMKAALFCGAILPVLLHHLVFFNFTADHELSTLKDAPIIAIAAACLAWRVWEKYKTSGGASVRRLAVASSAVLFCAGAVAQYRPLAGPSSYGYKTIGDYIAKNSWPDEVMFAQYQEASTRPLPQMVLYAHRNIAVWHDEKDAFELARRNGGRRIVVFVIDPSETRVVEVRRLDLGTA